MNEAAGLIQYFGDYWDGCEEMDNPAEARQQLLQKIVDQVFVYNDQVIAVALHGNFSVVFDTGEDDMPEEIASILKQNGCAIIFSDAQPGRERRASHSLIPTVAFEGQTGFCASLLGSRPTVLLRALCWSWSRQLSRSCRLPS